MKIGKSIDYHELENSIDASIISIIDFFLCILIQVKSEFMNASIMHLSLAKITEHTTVSLREYLPHIEYSLQHFQSAFSARQ